MFSLYNVDEPAQGQSHERNCIALLQSCILDRLKQGGRVVSDEMIAMADQPAARSGGGRRDRTDDLMLAKHALSQLSYAPNLDREAQRRSSARGKIEWWAWEDSNFRPHAYQARALTN